LVQYQYGHNSILALACYYARAGFGIVARWFSTSMGIVHYQYWHSLCQYQYWHFCILVEYQYGHSTLPALAFVNCVRTGIGISAPWFSSSIGTYHYWNWHSKMMLLPVLALLHVGSVPVWA
jgi:hypothetical protein